MVRRPFDELETFFGNRTIKSHLFDYSQYLDFDGLKGRVLSASYMPVPGEAGYDRLSSALIEIFSKFEQNGRVSIAYKTKMYIGQFG